MTTAPDHLTLATSAVDDVTCLLPPREALLDQLAERLPLAQTQPVTLFILGLLRRDDGRPVALVRASPHWTSPTCRPRPASPRCLRT